MGISGVIIGYILGDCSDHYRDYIGIGDTSR